MTMSMDQQLFLDNVKTKIQQYLYRSLETSFDPTIRFLQDTSLIGPINWHLDVNKLKMVNIFDGLSIAASTYSLTDGDFRTYMLLRMVDIVYEQFSEELFRAFVTSSYSVRPETVVGNLDTATTIQPPQNSQFPGISTGINSMNPLTQVLVPNVLYQSE